jgi:hypothetical protein
MLASFHDDIVLPTADSEDLLDTTDKQLHENQRCGQ